MALTVPELCRLLMGKPVTREKQVYNLASLKDLLAELRVCSSGCNGWNWTRKPWLQMGKLRGRPYPRAPQDIGNCFQQALLKRNVRFMLCGHISAIDSYGSLQGGLDLKIPVCVSRASGSTLRSGTNVDRLHLPCSQEILIVWR